MKTKIIIIFLLIILLGLGYLGVKKYQTTQQGKIAKEEQIQSLQKQLDEVKKEIIEVKGKNQILQDDLASKSQSQDAICPTGQYYGDNVVIFSTGSCEWAAGGPAKCSAYEKNQYPSIEECKLKNNLK
jgi:TolA-binding protein